MNELDFTTLGKLYALVAVCHSQSAVTNAALATAMIANKRDEVLQLTAQCRALSNEMMKLDQLISQEVEILQAIHNKTPVAC